MVEKLEDSIAYKHRKVETESQEAKKLQKEKLRRGGEETYEWRKVRMKLENQEAKKPCKKFRTDTLQGYIASHYNLFVEDLTQQKLLWLQVSTSCSLSWHIMAGLYYKEPAKAKPLKTSQIGRGNDLYTTLHPDWNTRQESPAGPQCLVVIPFRATFEEAIGEKRVGKHSHLIRTIRVHTHTTPHVPTQHCAHAWIWPCHQGTSVH